MSKANRRRQRPGNQPPPQADRGAAAGSRPARPAAGASASGRRHRPVRAGPAASGAGRPPGGGRTARRGHSPSDTARARGHLDQRPGTAAASASGPPTSRRSWSATGPRIVVVAALAGVALLSVFVFFSASQPAFACSTIWTPASDGIAGRRRDAEPRLRPAGHGPPARRPRREGDLHLLRAGVGHPLQPTRAAGRSPPASTARTTTSSRRAGSTTSNTAAWSSSTRAPAPGATPEGQAQLQGVLRGLPAGRRTAARSSPGSTR